jgi:hypothetical protein
MGMAGTRFGRNVPLASTWPDRERMLDPNPREISRRLMTRDALVPATAGNALIAAWLQFMLHDWFRHGTSPTDRPWVLPEVPGDDWPTPLVTVMRTPDDPTEPVDSDMLTAAHPDFDDETLFQRARLINAALLAKIHTIEWTPAVTAHPTAVAALHANWWGVAGKKLHDLFGRISGSEVISGIPGSQTDDFGVPFIACTRCCPTVSISARRQPTSRRSARRSSTSSPGRPRSAS